MNPYEILLMIDVGKTIAIELLSEFRGTDQELTEEEYLKAADALRQRRKSAILETKSH